MKFSTMRPTCGMLGLMLALTVSDAVSAETWPSRNIQAIVPLAPGNAQDVVSRIVFDQLSRQILRPVIVENRAGAGGTTGVAAVARAEPDGHTILVHSSSFSASYSLHKSLPYDTFKDFTAVVPLGIQPIVLVAAPSRGWKTAGDVIAAAKANPGKLNYASAGVGAASHLAAERFRLSAGISAQHIPFRGPVEAMTEVLTGRIDFYLLPVVAAISHINSGNVVALAVSTDKRAAALPNVPTMAEAGLKDASYAFWNGIFVPAKTPRVIVTKLHRETEKALAVPSVREQLAKVGQEPLSMTTEQFEKYFRDDVKNTALLMQKAGLQAFY
jgi:tripartite-type tricarboxylate transporter receptor subunit TctC